MQDFKSNGSTSIQNQTWSTEDGAKLKAMMFSNSLDNWQLSRLSALGAHQIEELIAGLPDGKSSYFYSEKIKYFAGTQLLEVLAALGNDLSDEAET